MTIRAFALCMLLPGQSATPIVGHRRPVSGQIYGATPCESKAFLGYWHLHRMRLDVAPPAVAFEWPPDCVVSTQSLETAFEIAEEEDVLEGDDGKPEMPAPILWPFDKRTYDVRYQLYDLGGRYDPETKRWTLPADRYEEAKALIEGVTHPTLF